MNCYRFGTCRRDKYQTHLMLLVITLFAAAFFSLPVISGEYLHAWDTSTHIFFSSGYLNGWWDTWESRWYGGYSRVSYPPLSHQLVAAIANIIGDLKLSYGVAVLAFLSIGPLAAYRFSRSFAGERSSVAAALLLVLLPSIRVMVFVFGQFAGFVSLVFLLLSVGAIGDYLRTGTKSTSIAAACWAACSAASHHGTTIFLLPPTLIVTTLAQFDRKKCSVRCFIGRSAVMWSLCAFTTLTVVFPFWIWLLDFQMQAPIPHLSRENFFQSPYAAQIFFLDLYGPFLFLIPFLITRRAQRRSQILLAATCVLFAVLGIGGTTPLPSLIYGERWQWLTFERFGIWATVLALPLAGQFIVKVRSKPHFYIGTLTLALLVFSASSWLIDPGKQRITPAFVELEQVFESFKDHPLCAERYLALGFGHQLPDFSTYTNAKTLDGLWHTARNDPLLRNSGIGSLSNALYWNNGKEVLKEFLSRQTPLPAYCIFINEVSPNSQEYRDIVVEQGWKLRTTFNNNVSLWVNDRISCQVTEEITFLPHTDKTCGYLWGTLPLLCLFLAISSSAISWLNRRTAL